jgi:hypothetical protein
MTDLWWKGREQQIPCGDDNKKNNGDGKSNGESNGESNSNRNGSSSPASYCFGLVSKIFS